MPYKTKTATITRTELAKINREFRAKDESNLWPICGKFNATDRAINRIAKARKEGMEIEGGLEYELALEAEISQIVNSII